MAGTTEQQASALADAEKLIGTVFADKYEIEAVLGAGGMGVVYKARHKLLDRAVAIKMLLPSVLVNEYRFKRFQKEARAASTLTHPNICAAFDFGTAGTSQVYMVMDYVEGRSLQEEIEHFGTLPPDRLIRIFIQVCEGLEHAHKNDVIHRDMKDSNIMLVDTAEVQDHVKIVDFGLAKMMSEDDNVEQRLTESGAVVGSPLFMSPEQCRGIKCDGRSDIYSLGCVLYKCMTGKVPFAGPTPLDTMYMHLNDLPAVMVRPPADSPVQQELHAALEKLAGRCLFKDPNHRYQTMTELKQALSGLHQTVAESIAQGAIEIPTRAVNTGAPTINVPAQDSSSSSYSQTSSVPVIKSVASPQQTFQTNSRAATGGRFPGEATKLERQRRELAATGSALVLIMLVATVIIVLAASSAQRPGHAVRPSLPADPTTAQPTTSEAATSPPASSFVEAAKGSLDAPEPAAAQSSQAPPVVTTPEQPAQAEGTSPTAEPLTR